jgi:hypothetical protein
LAKGGALKLGTSVIGTLLTRYRVLAVVLAAVIIAGASAAGGVAATQASAPTVIYAVVNSQSGAMKIVTDPNVKLNKNEHLLQRNQVGPARTAVPAGADGRGHD